MSSQFILACAGVNEGWENEGAVHVLRLRVGGFNDVAHLVWTSAPLGYVEGSNVTDVVPAKT